MFQMMRICLNCRSCLIINAESELGHEPDGSEHPERVLVKSLRGIADGPENLVLYVLLAFIRVYELIFTLIESNCVDRKVATSQILEQRSTELDHVRPAPIG